MSAGNPLSQRCTARCKSRDGQQCRKWVIGGGPNAVCDSHGGRAAQVRRAKELRLATMKAELEAAKKGLPLERRHPGEILLDAVAASDVLLTHLLRQRAAGKLSGEEALALGAAIDRAARTSKTAIDVNVTERLLEAQGRVTQAQANRLIAAMEALVHDPRVAIVGDPREVIRDALRELGPVEPAQQLAISG
jgi:hypothetical protein